MPIKVTCNSCSGVLHAPDDAAGKRGRCPTCGMILTIPTDAPRVAAEPVPAPPQAFGMPPGGESLAFPRPPAFGDTAKSSYSIGATSSTAAPGQSRLPPDPRRFGDPFAKPGKAPQVAVAEAVARRWGRVDSGLGLVRLGIVGILLGLLAPALLTIGEHNGLTLPAKDPGLLGVAGVAMADEIKFGAAMLPLALGGLAVVLGRFRIAGVPAESGARSVANAAAMSSALAFAGFIAFIAFVIAAAFANNAPKLIPGDTVLADGLRIQHRVELYARQILQNSSTVPGQAQRFGLLAFLAGGAVAELWFLGSLSRLAVFLRSPRAVSRVNRFAILIGLLLLAAAFVWLGQSLFARDAVLAQWNSLGTDSNKFTVLGGGLGAVLLIVAFIYTRSLRGLRTAIREASPS